jgi:hypothetical protein
MPAMPGNPLQRLAPTALIPWGWRTPATAELLERRLSLVAMLVVITGLTYSRLLAEGLGKSLYRFGNETLRAVQAWKSSLS